jgi:glycosyltransferase involved in cell wall biosynthesis
MSRCISWIIYGSLEQKTGGYVYDERVVAGLRAAGEDVQVCSIAPGQPPSAAEWRRSSVLVADELCYPELGQVFGEIARARAEGERTPHTVLLVHHLTAWEREETDAREAAVVRAADLVIATSHTSARRLELEFGVRARVCVPGADRLPLLARTLHAADAPLQLLFVGTWTERKGLAVLLEALARLGAQAYALHVAGDAARDADYARRCTALLDGVPELRARTHLYGVVTEERLAALYAECEVLILPSFFEGYGIVLGEARRAGLGVVASGRGSVEEVLTQGPLVHFFDAGEIPALVDIVAELIAQRAALRRLLLSGSQECSL